MLGIGYTKLPAQSFKNFFDDLTILIPKAMTMDEELDVTDIGATTFVITYSDKTKAQKTYYLSGDDFKDVFSIIKQMVPGCEYTPAVLLTSEDYKE